MDHEARETIIESTSAVDVDGALEIVRAPRGPGRGSELLFVVDGRVNIDPQRTFQRPAEVGRYRTMAALHDIDEQALIILSVVVESQTLIPRNCHRDVGSRAQSYEDAKRRDSDEQLLH